MIRLTRSDRLFPERLRAIFDPPKALYTRGAGEPEVLGLRAVAVVGARSCSAYGAQVARMLGRELASVGLVVVSGLARGIDGEAHRGALEASGLTVAVLGCGIDRDYPASNAALSRRIEENGLVVSEYDPGVEPAPWRFPARNREGRMDRRVSPTMRLSLPHTSPNAAPVWPGCGLEMCCGVGYRAMRPRPK